MTTVKSANGEIRWRSGEVAQRWKGHFAQLLVALPAHGLAPCTSACHTPEHSAMHIDLNSPSVSSDSFVVIRALALTRFQRDY